MIEDLRFIERGFPIDAENKLRMEAGQPCIVDVKRILQAYDGHTWFDVPFVSEMLSMDKP